MSRQDGKSLSMNVQFVKVQQREAVILSFELVVVLQPNYFHLESVWHRWLHIKRRSKHLQFLLDILHILKPVIKCLNEFCTTTVVVIWRYTNKI